MLTNLVSLRLISVGVIGMSLLAVAVGCNSTPVGSDSGRIDVYTTTKADRNSTDISMPELYQATDKVAEQLALELADIEAFSQSPTKIVLELGLVKNSTSTPTSDFTLMRNRLASRLKSSPVIRKRFMFVESFGRMQAEHDRVTGGNADLLQDGNKSSPNRYDPSITYTLLGDFMQANRGGRRYYFYEFKLVNVATREEVFSRAFDLSL